MTPQNADNAVRNLKVENTLVARTVTCKTVNYQSLNPAIPAPDTTSKAYLFVKQTNTQVIENNDTTPVSLNSVITNVGGFTFTTAESDSEQTIDNGAFIIPVDGLYVITFSVPYNWSVAGIRLAAISWSAQPGLRLGEQTVSGNDGFVVAMAGSIVINAHQGDVISLLTYQSAGAGLLLCTGNQCSHLTATWLSPPVS